MAGSPEAPLQSRTDGFHPDRGRATPSDKEPLLKVRNLKTRFFTEQGQVNAVEDLSLDVYPGEVLGIVGESGSGKSVTAMSIIGIIDSPGRITQGEIWLRDPDLAAEFASHRPDITDGDYIDIHQLPERVRRLLRGSRFSMVFQDPMTSFDPAYTVGSQIAEAVEVQRRATLNPRSVRSRTQDYGLFSFITSPVISSNRYVSKESFNRAVHLLERVGIPDAEERAREYPHQFSGGMLQRGMIAQALAADPDILIADEPTSALDVTIQAQILRLLREIQQDRDMSIVLITHDLGVIARMCHDVAVMYAGEVVEYGTRQEILEESVHPYTEGLLNSVPDLDATTTRLRPIDGNIPSLFDDEMGDHCYFADRCPKAMEACLSHPEDRSVGEDTDHRVKCVLPDIGYDPDLALSQEAKPEVTNADVKQ